MNTFGDLGLAVGFLAHGEVTPELEGELTFNISKVDEEIAAQYRPVVEHGVTIKTTG